MEATTRLRQAARTATRRAARRVLAEAGSVCVYQDGLMRIVQDRRLTVTGIRLLIALMCRVERGNQVRWSCRSIAEEFGLQYQSALRAWHYLEGQDWLRPQLNDHGRLVYWRLSPYLAWKGRPRGGMHAQAAWDSERKLARLAGEED